jgi:BirA family transcriptional regulator, biotin operon repressor / biotin---[acetyl-CoA-carboxylase] ligase
MSTLDDLRASLPIHGLGEPFFYFETVGSTNDFALKQAHQGVAHGALVLAEGQTAGRGRAGRVWYSTAKHALTFSLVLRPQKGRQVEISGLAGLGALAVVKALEKWTVRAAIKWPNDVLIDRKKVAGILVETSWIGESLEYAVMGIGINIRPASVPENDRIDYPATCVETEVGKRIDRYDVLAGVLESLGQWYDLMGTKELLAAWQNHLAFLNQEVVVHMKDEKRVGVLRGITIDGRLQLETSGGEQFLAASGDVRMRAVDTTVN